MAAITSIRIAPTQTPTNRLLVEALTTRVKRLELTLEYIAAVAGTYCRDEAEGNKFASLRDTALEMLNDELED